MDGYYDHGPVITLDRHVVLTGFLGDETRSVGYRVAALLGLSAVNIDRVVEHEAGRSVWDLIWSSGEVRYRQLEKRQIEKALAARPFSLISLGDGALIDPQVQRSVLAAAHLVLLDVDLANCFWRLKSTERAAADFWHPLHAGPLERIEQVRPFYQARRPGMDTAPHRVSLGGSSPARAVDAVVELAKRLADPAAAPNQPNQPGSA